MAKTNQAMQDLLRYNAAILPQKRSSFNKSHSHTTTLDSAYLVPLMWDRVLPGDEKKIRYSGLARMATPIHPVMDDANLDVWAFFVPDRLWWNHAKEFYGENKDASFNPDGEYVMPFLNPKRYWVRDKGAVDLSIDSDGTPLNGVGSLNDYFGFPRGSYTGLPDDDVVVGAPSQRVSAGLHRSYQLIWNEWFRNSSVQPALQLNDGDTVNDNEWNVISKIRKVCKYPDYFTSLLREPQAGDDVTLPLGEWAPVVTRQESHSTIPSDDTVGIMLRPTTGTTGSGSVMNLFLDPKTSDQLYMNPITDGPEFGNLSRYVYPDNLWADLTNATSATINNLRAAITVQQLLEIDSMSGKRYQQILQAHFGVFTPDATLQRPELLGCTRTLIGMRQVLQTSQSTDTSPQGNIAAFSLTSVSNEWIVNKSFTEGGFLIVVGAIRPVHSYSQGIDPLLTKLNRFDHYWPVFDHLGNQPVPTSAIFAVHDSDHSVGTPLVELERVFGYQQAWTEYKIRQNRVSGLMRPDFTGTLSSWNYTSDFAQAPVLNSAFVEENPALMDRVIATPSEPQFILDSYFDYIDIKNMSVDAIPGLLRL